MAPGKRVSSQFPILPPYPALLLSLFRRWARAASLCPGPPCMARWASLGLPTRESATPPSRACSPWRAGEGRVWPAGLGARAGFWARGNLLAALSCSEPGAGCRPVGPGWAAGGERLGGLSEEFQGAGAGFLCREQGARLGGCSLHLWLSTCAPWADAPIDTVPCAVVPFSSSSVLSGLKVEAQGVAGPSQFYSEKGSFILPHLAS